MSKTGTEIKITKEELLELEAQPKTKMQKKWDKIKLFMPFFFGVLAILEYIYVPNALKSSETTYRYVYLLTVLIGLYACFLFFSYKNKILRVQLVYKAPFYSFIFVLLMIYDLLTLKKNILVMPFFPWVDRVLNAMISDRILLLESVASSLKLLFSGYFIGAIVGLFTGVLCGYSKRVYYWVAPFIKLLGPIPTTTWLPLVMVVASSLYNGSVFIIALGVWYSVTVATITGISTVDRAYYEAAKTLGAKEKQLIVKIAIPASIPNIFQGLTVGMSSACVALMVAEMLGVESGLGWYINWQKSWAEYGKMYGAIVLICITFIIVNFILSSIKKRVLRWQEGIDN